MTTGFVWHERFMWHHTGAASGSGCSAVGVSAAAAVAAGIYWRKGDAAVEDLGKACGPDMCTDADVEAAQVEKFDLVTTVGLVTSLVAGAVGLTLLLADSDDGDDETAATATHLGVGLGSVFVSGKF